MRDWTTETSPLGRVFIPPALPAGKALFYTTSDWEGRLDAATVASLPAFLSGRFGIGPVKLATCRQVHGTALDRVAAGDEGWSECSECDALWSADRNVALGIKVADCLPVTLIDPDHSVIGNIHSGWRGAAAGIVEASLRELNRSSPFEPRAAHAWLGPSIRACCFEVGEEVVASFVSAFPGAERFVVHRSPRPHFDLAAFTIDRLREAGFEEDAIHDSRLCTRCEGSPFHSWRRDAAAAGRNLAVVAQ